MNENLPQAAKWHRTILPSFLTGDDTLDNHSSIKFHHPFSNALPYDTCESFCDANYPISFSSAARNVFKRLVVIYTRQPFVLTILPLLTGVLIGYLISCQYKRSSSSSSPLRRCQSLLASFLFSILRRRHQHPSVATHDKQTRQSLKQLPLRPLSNIPQNLIPRHIAVIMDGNRRYGKSTYGVATRGHVDGSRKLVEFSKWCLAEGISVLTVYAFSTENWMRDAHEVNTLMSIFVKYCEEMRVEAIENGISIRVVTTDDSKLPEDVKRCYKTLVEDTSHGNKMVVNICLSYGGRGEIVTACRSVIDGLMAGEFDKDEITEEMFEKRLLLPDCPDVVVRTSGEKRLSNFLLWQLAYAEMFFWDKRWPEVTREDLVGVIRNYAMGRQRRFGK